MDAIESLTREIAHGRHTEFSLEVILQCAFGDLRDGAKFRHAYRPAGIGVKIVEDRRKYSMTICS